MDQTSNDEHAANTRERMADRPPREPVDTDGALSAAIDDTESPGATTSIDDV